MMSFPSSSSKAHSRPIASSSNANASPLLSRQKHSVASTSTSTPFRLSSDQLSEIREAFELFDHDRDQQLDYHEFKVCLRALGFDLKKAEVVRLLKEANGVNHANVAGGVGVNVGEMRIGYERFTNIVEGMIQRRDPMLELKRAFRLFDEEGTGKISLDNLRKVASDLGEQLGDEELRAMIDEFDLDQDGMINEAEFMSIMADDV
ncbi:hypothetical protein MVLG_04448 [Microbotryum lychnidis-dioicae p1A1 Lamole]|uniref:EF-hand domain-containing protein n=1 Tax=Microbotryum lychnidis-dioicae (strain p1A1 Lamole / MvSl-1064) TaxID=683840 RepID=U5HB94_USTV1|nr:hypothetical protein MVLG_04448 [Microbotryum lychnidis-dioicae p1A1 Lamole]|eukprot:KDE05210.1 hypothetical protein MVLG_04448 [Microbotryum lychnidis-dioicae p1A1 Lamole]